MRSERWKAFATRHRFALLVASVASMAVLGCGDSGPRNNDAKNAVLKQIDEAAGNDPLPRATMMNRTLLPDMSKYEVKETKCSHAGQDTYDCVVTASYEGRSETKQMKLVKLKSGWAMVN